MKNAAAATIQGARNGKMARVDVKKLLEVAAMHAAVIHANAAIVQGAVRSKSARSEVELLHEEGRADAEAAAEKKRQRNEDMAEAIRKANEDKEKKKQEYEAAKRVEAGDVDSDSKEVEAPDSAPTPELVGDSAPTRAPVYLDAAAAKYAAELEARLAIHVHVGDTMESTASTNKQVWACDFCRSAVFTTLEEASLHEQTCKRNPNQKKYHCDYCHTAAFATLQEANLHEMHCSLNPENTDSERLLIEGATGSFARMINGVYVRQENVFLKMSLLPAEGEGMCLCKVEGDGRWSIQSQNNMGKASGYAMSVVDGSPTPLVKEWDIYSKRATQLNGRWATEMLQLSQLPVGDRIPAHAIPTPRRWCHPRRSKVTLGDLLLMEHTGES